MSDCYCWPGLLDVSGNHSVPNKPPSPNILFNKQKAGIILQWRRHGGLTQRKAKEIQKYEHFWKEETRTGHRTDREGKHKTSITAPNETSITAPNSASEPEAESPLCNAAWQGSWEYPVASTWNQSHLGCEPTLPGCSFCIAQVELSVHKDLGYKEQGKEAKILWEFINQFYDFWVIFLVSSCAKLKKNVTVFIGDFYDSQFLGHYVNVCPLGTVTSHR